MEAELKFEREKRNGIAVVGSYLIDAAGRLGVEIEAACGRLGQCDDCAVKITGGGECLSDLTRAETEQLKTVRRKNGERLACQAKITKTGEISIMTHEKKTAEKPSEEQKAEDFKKEFADLPLEKKIAHLVDLEAITLSETISYVLNSPYTIGGKIIEILAEMGLKFDKEAKEATRPEEHQEETQPEPEAKKETKSEKAPPKRTRKTPPKSKTEKDVTQ